MLRRGWHQEQLFWQVETEAADDGEDEAGEGADDEGGEDGVERGAAEVADELEVDDVGEAEEERDEEGKEMEWNLVAEGGFVEGEAEVGKGDGKGGEGGADDECKKGGGRWCGGGCGHGFCLC